MEEPELRDITREQIHQAPNRRSSGVGHPGQEIWLRTHHATAARRSVPLRRNPRISATAERLPSDLSFPSPVKSNFFFGVISVGGDDIFRASLGLAQGVLCRGRRDVSVDLADRWAIPDRPDSRPIGDFRSLVDDDSAFVLRRWQRRENRMRARGDGGHSGAGLDVSVRRVCFSSTSTAFAVTAFKPAPSRISMLLFSRSLCAKAARDGVSSGRIRSPRCSNIKRRSSSVMLW